MPVISESALNQPEMSDPSVLAEMLADLARVAVVVIDMQRDFCSATGAFAQAGVNIDANARIVDPIADFVDVMRRAGARVIWCLQLASQHHRSAALQRRLRRAPIRLSLCQEGTPGTELADGLRVDPADAVIRKYRYSAFLGSSLDQTLRSTMIQTVVLVGTAANACVDTTARDAAQLDYDVVIPADLVGYTDSRLAQAALENLDRHFAYVCTAQDVLAAGRIK